MNIAVLDAVQVGLWFVAAAISLYFSIGNARIWTSISTGFLLIFVSEAYVLVPYVSTPRLVAIHAIIGTIAVMVMTHGFQEYYVFSRTMEVRGRKWTVYAMTFGVILASGVFLWINPAPNAATLRHIRIIENGNWVFLSLINIDMIRKIYLEIRDSQIARGFIAFGVVFICLTLWHGSELYLQVFCWDDAWANLMVELGGAVDMTHAARVTFSRGFHEVTGMATSVAVGGTFAYLLRLMR